LKNKTDERNAKTREAKAKNSGLTRRVKIATSQAQWAAFGLSPSGDAPLQKEIWKSVRRSTDWVAA